VLDKLKKEILSSLVFQQDFPRFLNLLKHSGMLDYLRDRGRARPGVSWSLQQSSAEAHRSTGYNQCLDDLFNFIEQGLKVEQETIVSESMRPDFGSLQRLMKDKQITEQEAQIIRQKRTVNEQSAN